MLGLVLVGAYTSDLGDSNEAASGYFKGRWLNCSGAKGRIEVKRAR